MKRELPEQVKKELARYAEVYNASTLTLDGLALTSLPEEILAIASRVEVLSLAGNKLTAVPAELQQFTKLRRLGLERNRIATLPDWFPSLTRLVKLDLSANRFTELPAVLLQMPGLRTLVMARNKIARLPRALADAANLLDPAGKETSLDKLELSNNPCERLLDREILASMKRRGARELVTAILEAQDRAATPPT